MTMGIDDERAAVNSLVPNNKSHIKNGVIVTWDSEETQPTEAEIDAEMIRLQAEYNAQAYARSRQAEYPSLLELTVALYDTDDKSAVEAKRAKVKAKYPKPS
jgi:hypothetical protein